MSKVKTQTSLILSLKKMYSKIYSDCKILEIIEEQTGFSQVQFSQVDMFSKDGFGHMIT